MNGKCLQTGKLTTYLRLTNIKLGLLMNFNTPLIKNGIHRIVNKL
ncbi:GxxExxY protein [Chryseobacterium chendengshani]|nr:MULTISPECIES: GxxExxY protein [unclassified Chryseobacterium]MBW7673951.1 GxxExxY protein [Chryseobacterium sp. LJ756]MBW8523107.1 GxxExxY protein [Chryseobacterium sp. LJ668]QYK18063.1 GxxExxY protein [Chryseobacterium sp. LJ668]